MGEDSGQLEQMLLKVADIYDEEVRRTLQRLVAVLVPLVTIGLGMLVAGIIGTMLTSDPGDHTICHFEAASAEC